METLAFNELNLIVLCTFLKNNRWFNACFKYIICITYSVLSFKLTTCFWTFSIFIFSGKKGKSLWRSSIFFKILNINFKKLSFNTLFFIVFYKIFIKSRSIFNLLKIIYQRLLRNCPTTEMIYIPILKTWRFYIFTIIFRVLVISFCVFIN